MPDTAFFPRGAGLSLNDVSRLTGCEIGEGTDPDLVVTGIGPLDHAAASDLSFFDNPRYADQLASTRAGCVIVAPKHRHLLPDGLASLVTPQVQGAFAAAGRALHPAALTPQSTYGSTGISPQAAVHPTARLEEDVTIEAFASIGPGVAIGRGTLVASGAVIAANCSVGRNCRIGAQVSLSNALLGDRVILHPGVKIGQDGFGYVPGPAGIEKVVQVGRVIIQDDVEIGANSTIDRGAVRDTVIGEGTKIDNQVQIGHNVTIGRFCIIVAQVGISGSCKIGDGVMIGGQAGISGHVTIGDRAQIAATAGLESDVPPGERWGGIPARPVRQWMREIKVLSNLTKRGRAPKVGEDE
ncbi:UDP-3-O-(3-hydroxymyristoyl)glucosamine N-acyltransferase [Jiella marina]|uniref:UDP-3-O-(3-hydroxymyristoyl)glucosamine N-acyltransferase n=1 Tax=Jiella sp. LLJ827 TaxID=2917712 RepID=UPI00210195F4|nr:UDP-3-O-(3-hydroxymyristoyl)glucosamine N-acyltransferase [Jiella sp. LLJ827]MCQ0986865.1 UDP-3-O-(3-hydroxymyristoyl)glucosamine N-acyltransferase [Jiella sp. LLJ827]